MKPKISSAVIGAILFAIFPSLLFAQDSEPVRPLFEFEIGPGFASTSEVETIPGDTTDVSLETYLGIGMNASDDVFFGIRAEMSQGRIIDGVLVIRGYPFGDRTKAGAVTFLQLKAALVGGDIEGDLEGLPIQLTFGGGGELRVSDSVVAFGDINGRYIPEVGEFDPLIGGGIRIGFGRRS